MARKLKEAQIALQLEQSLSKEEILTRYLNIVSFGNGAAGVAAAARRACRRDTSPPSGYDRLTTERSSHVIDTSEKALSRLHRCSERAAIR
ncbi:MAG: transglycosylase domain-containing protein [Pseudonocardia sp.]|nr:transglycosylase domain-containing protein [Pseudonocardia sp.]